MKGLLEGQAYGSGWIELGVPVLSATTYEVQASLFLQSPKAYAKSGHGFLLVCYVPGIHL